MVQAKKKTTRKTKKPTLELPGLGMLVTGIVIGVLATNLWFGMRSEENGVGSGIREFIQSTKENSKQSSTIESSDRSVQAEPEVKAKTNYDFYTVLPEIEVVVTPTVKTLSQPEDKPEAKTESKTTEKTTSNSAYMLQAGSYKNNDDAEKLKANLALNGLSSTIQKVTIQERGDFYRVRLGPYISYEKMIDVDRQLGEYGIKALLLKVSKGG